MAVSDLKSYELQSLTKELVVAPLSFDLASGTTGVSASRLPPGFSIERTDVGEYTLTCPRGHEDGVYVHLSEGSGTTAAYYWSDYSNVSTGEIVITRTYSPTDPPSAQLVTGFISYRAVFAA